LSNSLFLHRTRGDLGRRFQDADYTECGDGGAGGGRIDFQCGQFGRDIPRVGRQRADLFPVVLGDPEKAIGI
jgi:hypothetical protein